MQSRCDDCKYYDNSSFPNETRGYCKRYPPTKNELVGTRMWPQWLFVDAGEWCGEYKKKNGFFSKNGCKCEK